MLDGKKKKRVPLSPKKPPTVNVRGNSDDDFTDTGVGAGEYALDTALQAEIRPKPDTGFPFKSVWKKRN